LGLGEVSSGNDGSVTLEARAWAVALLGMREPDARRWLAEYDLIHEVAGRQRVIAGDLTEAIRSAGRKGPSVRKVAPVRRLPLSSRL
jgi:hypothetical protein